MPLPDNVFDRLKGALVSTDTTQDDGAPGLITADPSGFTVPGISTSNTAQTLTQNPNTSERAKVSGFEVTWSGPGVHTEVTVSVLGSGAAILTQYVSPSGGTVPLTIDYALPVDAGLAATVQLYVGPGGASIRTLANLRGYSVGGR